VQVKSPDSVFGRCKNVHNFHKERNSARYTKLLFSDSLFATNCSSHFCLGISKARTSFELISSRTKRCVSLTTSCSFVDSGILTASKYPDPQPGCEVDRTAHFILIHESSPAGSLSLQASRSLNQVIVVGIVLISRHGRFRSLSRLYDED